MARRRIGQEDFIARPEPRAASSLPELAALLDWSEIDRHLVGISGAAFRSSRVSYSTMWSVRLTSSSLSRRKRRCSSSCMRSVAGRGGAGGWRRAAAPAAALLWQRSSPVTSCEGARVVQPLQQVHHGAPDLLAHGVPLLVQRVRAELAEPAALLLVAAVVEQVQPQATVQDLRIVGRSRVLRSVQKPCPDNHQPLRQIDGPDRGHSHGEDERQLCVVYEPQQLQRVRVGRDRFRRVEGRRAGLRDAPEECAAHVHPPVGMDRCFSRRRRAWPERISRRTSAATVSGVSAMDRP